MSYGSLKASPGNRNERVLPRYAIIFRTHFWDDFATRQLERIRARSRSGDLYVLVDETRGKVEGIKNDRIFSLTDAQTIEAGYVDSGDGSMQWFSGDVPLYMFRRAWSDYDYYVQLEYDVNVASDLDNFVLKVAQDGVDMVALKNDEHHDTWKWMPSCLDVYPEEEVIHQLICFSVFSAKALDRLSAARLQQAALFRDQEITRWPFCEAFIATEAVRQKLKVRELSEYGDVSLYEWWPPYLERDLQRFAPKEFIHPVLDESRYVSSLLKHDIGFRDLLFPHRSLHRKLQRLGPVGYISALAGSDYRRALWNTVKLRKGEALAGAATRDFPSLRPVLDHDASTG